MKFHRRRTVETVATRQIEMLVSGGDGTCTVVVEPEAMHYDFPPQERVLLTFIVPDRPRLYFDVSRDGDCLTIWRPADSEVWATLANGEPEQIGGFSDNPFPWLDSQSPLHPEDAPWTWPPPSA